MKKLINRPEDVVSEMLQGLSLSNPKLEYFPREEVIARKRDTPIEKVGIVSGGGSGHEPAHAGYVGEGMLDAAVAGNVFASPSPDRILCGIHQADHGKGVLLVIKNYSGDIMNFEMAMELAQDEGIEVDRVVVRDDVAVPNSTYSSGRRGIAGTVFVHKIAGAAAEANYSLPEVKRVAEKAIAGLRTMGMALTSCTLPGAGKVGFALGEDDIEIGMGIHGEPGVSREPIKSAQEIAAELFAHINEDYDYTGKEVAVMVNGLGGTPLMELYIMNNELQQLLEEKDIRVYRTFVGNYMTSLEMAGCSFTLLELDDELKQLLDAHCDTTALKI